MAPKVLLKDQLFNRPKVEKIAGELRRVYPAFEERRFVGEVVARFPELELKARIGWIAECLKQRLPADYRAAVAVILGSLPAPCNPDLGDDDFGDFIYAPYAEYVARYGRQPVNLACSLDALYQITMRFSAEDAIRYFLNDFPDETLRYLERWSRDSHYHVRRLCSEGTRPKLPWARKLSIPVHAPLPLLDTLFADPTRYVVRSVANHLNDLSKLEPELTIRTLARWKKTKRQTPAEMDYIIRHALRTLIKTGHPAALGLLGVSSTADVRLRQVNVPARVKMNAALEFSCTLRAREAARVVIDYVLYFQGKGGAIGGRKVFKLKSLKLGAGESIILTKRHLLRENMTTRKLYRGRHEIEIQINGTVRARRAFQLV